MSKYSPGQGLILALGQSLTSYPIVGIWLSAALAGAALCWMLYRWLPQRYALLGGILAAGHPLLIRWSHDYWGGLLALTGGALAIGGFRATVDDARPRDAGLMGFGIMVMALTRPYEGLVLTALLLGALPWFMRQRPLIPFRVWIARCGLPLAIPVVLFAVGTGIYNHAVTGSVLRLPYTVHEQQYDPAPLFIWQRMRRIPQYRHAEIRDFYLQVILPPYLSQRTVHGFVASRIDKLSNLLVEYLRPLTLIIPLMALPWAARRDRWTRCALIVSGLFFLLLLQNVYLSPHYISLYVGIGCSLLLVGLRQLRVWRWHGKRTGRVLARLVVVSYIVSSINIFAMQVWQHVVGADAGWSMQRARILSRLRQTAGDHLVVVRYSPKHNLHAEWVYNEANIDRSRVVWAHEMDTKSNEALFRYFRGRRIWLVLADAEPSQLVPYPMKPPSQLDPTAP